MQNSLLDSIHYIKLKYMQAKINGTAWVNISMSDLEKHLKILEIRKIETFYGRTAMLRFIYQDFPCLLL